MPWGDAIGHMANSSLRNCGVNKDARFGRWNHRGPGGTGGATVADEAPSRRTRGPVAATAAPAPMAYLDG
ncbi:hypothetical protein GCM10018791_28550 [Streptomyces zaomyceticus]|nr:hypothetical protein GCM10018791_28550 [Streptomyces zaomyceticus]